MKSTIWNNEVTHHPRVKTRAQFVLASNGTPTLFDRATDFHLQLPAPARIATSYDPSQVVKTARNLFLREGAHRRMDW